MWGKNVCFQANYFFTQNYKAIFYFLGHTAYGNQIQSGFVRFALRKIQVKSATFEIILLMPRGAKMQ